MCVPAQTASANIFILPLILGAHVAGTVNVSRADLAAEG
jgi:hypothetical protein